MHLRRCLVGLAILVTPPHAAAESFNSVYTRGGPFLMINSIRALIAQAIALFVVLVALAAGVVVLVRRRRAARAISVTGVQPPPRTV